MNHTRTSLICLIALAALVGTLSGCTVKATIKTTTDAMTNFLSSTSGHPWFTQDGVVKQNHKVHAFVAMNFDNLKQDMARGEGEYVTSLGTLLGVPNDRLHRFSILTRERYPVLVLSDRTTPAMMLAALSRQLSGPSGSKPPVMHRHQK